LAALPQLLGWAQPLLAPGGTALFLKGKSFAAELTEARAGWQMTCEILNSRTDPDGAILKVSDIRRADQE
jgi:16S rRNA (guanine527-N7)-methyltransferase